MTRKLNQN